MSDVILVPFVSAAEFCLHAHANSRWFCIRPDGHSGRHMETRDPDPPAECMEVVGVWGDDEGDWPYWRQKQRAAGGPATTGEDTDGIA